MVDDDYSPSLMVAPDPCKRALSRTFFCMELGVYVHVVQPAQGFVAVHMRVVFRPFRTACAEFRSCAHAACVGSGWMFRRHDGVGWCGAELSVDRMIMVRSGDVRFVRCARVRVSGATNSSVVLVVQLNHYCTYTNECCRRIKDHVGSYHHGS